MRALVLVFSLLASAAPALAQEWDEFVALQDGFRINFPGKLCIKIFFSIHAFNVEADTFARLHHLFKFIFPENAIVYKNSK